MPQAGVIDGYVFAIDGYVFAQTGESITGRLALAELPRLADSGCRSAEVSFSIVGGMNARGKPSLIVRASGQVQMTCQRCLEPVAEPIDVDSELELSADEVEIATAEDDVDRVLASEAMNVARLVEDEILLALPMVPKHESCGVHSGDRPGGQRSPFAGLAALKKDR